MSSRRSKRSSPSTLFTSPGASTPSARPVPDTRLRFTSPASTRRSTAATRTSPTSSALPRSLREAGVRRYGFHGLSYEYIARRLSELDPEVAKGRVVAAHLGYGASLCALRNGRSVDSTMTFTALDGLVMSTRPGSLDAGVVLWLLDRGWDRERIARLLWNESGLLALSEKSADLREHSRRPERRPPGSPSTSSSTRPSSRPLRWQPPSEVWTASSSRRGSGRISRRRGGASQKGFPSSAWPSTRKRTAGTTFESGAPGARVATFVVPTDEEDVIARHTLAALRKENPAP